MLRLFIFVYSLILVNGELTTNVNRCDQRFGGLPHHVYIQGCVNPPCQVKQREDISASIIFTAPRTMRGMTTRASASVAGQTIPYDLQEDGKTCNFLENTYCPVYKDEVIQYTLRMHIHWWIPPVSNIQVDLRVEDDDGGPVWCFSTMISVTPA